MIFITQKLQLKILHNIIAMFNLIYTLSLQEIAVSLLLGTFCYVIYIEYTIGNVLFRRNDDNNLVLSKSILVYFIAPFQGTHMWTIDLIDLNSVLFIGLTSFLFYLQLHYLPSKTISMADAWDMLN